MSIYTQMIDAGVPVDGHESDLHAKVTPESHEIIKSYGPQVLVSVFISNLDGCAWYEILFAYDPWWENRIK